MEKYENYAILYHVCECVFLHLYIFLFLLFFFWIQLSKIKLSFKSFLSCYYYIEKVQKGKKRVIKIKFNIIPLGFYIDEIMRKKKDSER